MVMDSRRIVVQARAMAIAARIGVAGRHECAAEATGQRDEPRSERHCVPDPERTRATALTLGGGR